MVFSVSKFVNPFYNLYGTPIIQKALNGYILDIEGYICVKDFFTTTEFSSILPSKSTIILRLESSE